MKPAIVTISSDNYIAGTLVLLQSVRQENEWFNGDFIIIDGGLSDENADLFKSKFNAIIKAPNKEIEQKLNLLTNDIPYYQKRRPRFYSLEIFDIKEYDKILYLDSDMLCTGNFQELFAGDYIFAACPDQRYYQGFVRNKKTFDFVPSNDATHLFADHFIDRLFNTGLMLIDNKKIGDKVYELLVNMLSKEYFEDIETRHTDTVVLNRLLLDKVEWLDLKFNFYSTLFETSYAENTKPVCVHFIGKKKPWNTEMNNIWASEWDKTYKQIYAES